ncbi:MAG TPA: TonB-dependent receptor [Pseudoxanthomonas sp.]|nr:TonB-dependent receptor [Pseudoxanthomonas sp.]
MELDQVTVIGSRTPRALAEVPISISVVGEQEFADQLDVSSNVLESLDVLVPGLTTSREEARSGCSTNIRGRQAQFLINGVPTNDNLRRSACSSLYSVSPFAIERIEVLRGATALYGAGAPGGAIDLQTRRARSSSMEVDVVAQWGFNPGETGATGETNFYLGAGEAFPEWDYYAGVSGQDYGTRRNPDGGTLPGETFESWSANASLGRNIGDSGTLRLTGLFYRKDPTALYVTDSTQVAGQRLARSAFAADPPNPYASRSETEQSLVTLSYDQAAVLGHALSVSAYWHDERLVQRAADFFGGAVSYTNSDAENQRLGLRTSLNRVIAVGGGALDLTYGIDLLRQRYFRPLVNPASGAVAGYIAPEVLLDSAALFVQSAYQRGDWRFTGGVRHERFNGEVGDEGYNPALPRASTPGNTPGFDLTLLNLGAVYDLRDGLQLYGGFSQGAEISEFGRAARGVSIPSRINLDGATSDQYEIGLRGRLKDLDVSAAAFYSTSDKAASLQADPSCAGQALCPLIPLRLEQDIHGLELAADWPVSERLRLGSLLTWQRGDANPPGATPVPLGADSLAPLRVTAYAAFQPLPQWSNRLQATYHASSDFYDAQEEARGYRDTASVSLVDFSSAYTIGRSTFSLGVSNLLDEKYVNVTNQASGDFFYYLSEGRRVTLTYRLRY